MAPVAKSIRLRTVHLVALLVVATVLVSGALAPAQVAPIKATPATKSTATDDGSVKIVPDAPPATASADAATKSTAVVDSPFKPLPAGKPAVIDDVQLYHQMEVVGTTLMESGKATPMKDLMSQLSRTRCDVKLAKPTGKTLAGSDLYDRAKASVVVMGGLYHCDKCGRNHCTTASGYFLTESGIAVTNYHVVNNAKNLTLICSTADGKVYPVKSVLAASAVSDVAIVQVDGSGFKPLPIVADAAAGSDVFVLSHPDGRFFTLTRGIVSRYGTVVRDHKQTTMLQITAEFAKGSSGGPVLNPAGEVVGMVSSTVSVYYNDDHGKAGDFQMVLNQCVPAGQVLELIRPQ
jgi:S1-C subfamily serine protease